MRAVEALAEQVGALGPQLAGRLEAHTAHLIGVHEAGAQAAAEREAGARRSHGEQLQALAQALTGALSAIAAQGEEGRRQAEEARTRLRAAQAGGGGDGRCAGRAQRAHGEP